MTNSLANTSPSANSAPRLKLDLRQQRAFHATIEAARREPGSLRVLAKYGLVYTAQSRDGRIRYTVRDHTKAIILQGDYS